MIYPVVVNENSIFNTRVNYTTAETFKIELLRQSFNIVPLMQPIILSLTVRMNVLLKTHFAVPSELIIPVFWWLAHFVRFCIIWSLLSLMID